MLKKKIEKAFNKQINAELYSAYLYLGMSAYFDDIGLPGCSQWMKIQSQEEITHAMKFFRHISERGGRVELDAIEKPLKEWESPLHVFKSALKHEQLVTSLIDGLVDIAIKEKDHASNNFLQWFVAEQVEEEESAGDIVDKLELIGEDRSALFMLDNSLGARVFTPDTEEK
ncbi:MAG: ferritin [Candidatus Muiribacteriaceae bacterium]